MRYTEEKRMKKVNNVSKLWIKFMWPNVYIYIHMSPKTE